MRYNYKIGEFIDFTDRVRSFVMVAVYINAETELNEVDPFGPFTESEGVISVGVSVCRPGDTFDKKIGISIAKGKATKKRDHAIYATDPGLLSGNYLDIILEQEFNFFIKNPGSYLAGYDKDKEKFEEKENVAKTIENLTPEQKDIYNYIDIHKGEIKELMTNILCQRK